MDTIDAIDAKDIGDVSNLPDISPQDQEFVRLLMFDASVDGNATEAFRRAYPRSEANETSKVVLACKKRNHPHIQKWIKYMRAANLDRLACSLGQHLSELALLREEARADGQFAAAINAEVKRGQVAGHYIERKEITYKKGDDLSKLIELARGGKLEIAESYAKDLGLYNELLNALDLRPDKDGVWSAQDQIGSVQ